ncbi:MAG: hypothetical protein HY520_01190 [Candidatus Aenigmarchaeota archaeon]|nr:hypothetical protein [Candidatus Aenigmarchaeota archaeon]
MALLLAPPAPVTGITATPFPAAALPRRHGPATGGCRLWCARTSGSAGLPRAGVLIGAAPPLPGRAGNRCRAGRPQRGPPAMKGSAALVHAREAA